MAAKTGNKLDKRGVLHDPRLTQIRTQLRQTQVGLLAERSLRQFWPAVSIVMLVVSALMLGMHDALPVEMVWVLAGVSVFGLLWALIWGVRGFRWPRGDEALATLDASLSGNPIGTLLDQQAIGLGDGASELLWKAHQDRMAQRMALAVAPKPNLRIAKHDPFALRYLALLFLVVGMLFGSIWRVESLAGMAPGAAAPLAGPSWEGWIEPPLYTGLPVLYLNDQAAGGLTIPEGSRITLRFYGEVGDLSLEETISTASEDAEALQSPEQVIPVVQDGDFKIIGYGGREWAITVVQDEPPRIAASGLPELSEEGRLTLPFSTQDDYGVVGGELRIALDLLAIPRRYGLAVEPDSRAEIVLDLPMPVTGGRRAFMGQIIEDFSRHPWANLPAIFTFIAQDGADQQGTATGLGGLLTARRFFDPLAAALVEQRRDLLWAKANGPRVTQVLRTLSHRPETVFRSAGDYLRFRGILRRLESYVFGDRLQPLTDGQQEEIAEALWLFALSLEEGDVGDALARMQRAQERLSQAMRNGASPEEINSLMRELREATQDYLRQLQRQAQQGQQEEGPLPDDATVLSQQDLQKMMDRIQELMEQGRMAEAEQALREFQQMMENMRTTQNQQGQSGEGQETMEGLADTLREQQGLSDQAFRDLQEQFNPNAQRGQNQRNEGRNGGQGRGQDHEGGSQQGGTSGQGTEGRQSGEGSQQGREPSGGTSGQGGDQPGAQSGDLASRQQSLREELLRQQQGMPQGGGEAGESARDAIDRAGRAMEGAEQSLREGDLAGAIDHQSDAMEALREGLRSLGEALAEQRRPGQQDGQGQLPSASRSDQRDPLGRSMSPDAPRDGGRIGIGDGRAHRRAWDLLEELRRRAGERERSEGERNYIERLLDKF